VPDQEHAIISVEHHAADTQRHAASGEPIQVEDPPQLRFEALAQALQGRHANPGWTAITFDPYIDGMSMRRLYITADAAERG